jgi:hypothetical protein
MSSSAERKQHNMVGDQQPFLQRLWIYQKERFPFVQHGILITVFTFSAVSYSRICRGVEGFIAWQDFVIGVFATFTLFFLVRIFDEHKDQVEDAKYRKYLPVPRGLISLAELRKVGWTIALLQIAVISILQTRMLWLYLLVMGYLLLMGVEFFVPAWLKQHQIAYITSHMVIIPLVDMYSSGLDWLLDDDTPHWGLAWFFAVSYMNGLVLEFGRKLRIPEDEEKGVVSYTGLYGTKGGVAIWSGLLSSTALLAVGAGMYAGFPNMAAYVFGVALVICMMPAILFLVKPKRALAKAIEIASALWTLLMYLALGAIPMLANLI